MKHFFDTVTREADGGAAPAPASGAPAGAAPAPAGGAPAPADGKPAEGGTPPPAPAVKAAELFSGKSGEAEDGKGAPAPGTLYTPEGLPEQFRGKTDQETIDKLLADVSGRAKPPATAKDYAFEPAEAFKTRYGDLKDDPVFGIWREVAHKAGLDQKQFAGVIEPLYESLEKAGLIEGPIDFDAELKKLEPQEGERAERILKATNRVHALSSLIKGLETRKEITKQEAVLLSSIHANASSVQAFEKLFSAIKAGGEHGIQPGGQPGGSGAYTWDSADRDLADARYSTTSPQYDKKFREDADRRMGALPPRKAFRVA